MKQEKRCLYCGHIFTARRANRKYCSDGCRRKASERKSDNRERCHVGTPIREFDCRTCGKHVNVVEASDKRTVFCCASCEKKYWKHAYRYKDRGRGSDMGMSGGMSLGGLIRREKGDLL